MINLHKLNLFLENENEMTRNLTKLSKIFVERNCPGKCSMFQITRRTRFNAFRSIICQLDRAWTRRRSTPSPPCNLFLLEETQGKREGKVYSCTMIQEREATPEDKSERNNLSLSGNFSFLQDLECKEWRGGKVAWHHLRRSTSHCSAKIP